MPKEDSFDTGDVDIHYVEWPDAGPPLLLLHGLATRWQIFRPLIQGLTQCWHVFAIDFRGHGKSGRVPGGYNVDNFVEDTVAFMRQQIHEPAVLFGHSMGGWIALALANQHPSRVKGVVLADTAMYPGMPDDQTVTALFGMTVADVRSGASGSSNAWPQAMRELDPGVLLSYVDGELTTGFAADLILPSVTCPVLLLQGNPEAGGFMTDDDVQKALALLKNRRHIQFDRAGHWLHVQEAEHVVRETNNLLVPA